jgi:type IV pilus assembly protein PilE
MRRNLPLVPTKPRGFSLIELMITLAIVAVLASIAYPSFMDSLRKSRRSDAVAALVRVQHAQERFRANNANYSGGFDATGADTALLPMSNASPDGHYTLSIANSNAISYTVVATANSNSPQAADHRCASLQVQIQVGGGVNQGLTVYGSTDSSGTLNVASGNLCWAK